VGGRGGLAPLPPPLSVSLSLSLSCGRDSHRFRAFSFSFHWCFDARQWQTFASSFQLSRFSIREGHKLELAQSKEMIREENDQVGKIEMDHLISRLTRYGNKIGERERERERERESGRRAVSGRVISSFLCLLLHLLSAPFDLYERYIRTRRPCEGALTRGMLPFLANYRSSR